MPHGSRTGTWVPGYVRLPTLETCPGYTTALPEVQEVAATYPHWKARYLTEYLEEVPSPAILDGISILDRAINDRDIWDLEQTRKGGQ